MPSSSKVHKLEDKYEILLKATSRLFERTARRHKSNRDLERTVVYLRSLYNQVTNQKHSFEEEPEDISYDSGSEELCQKTCHMVEVDKEHRIRKRIEKERSKNESKLTLWNKWQR